MQTRSWLFIGGVASCVGRERYEGFAESPDIAPLLRSPLPPGPIHKIFRGEYSGCGTRLNLSRRKDQRRWENGFSEGSPARRRACVPLLPDGRGLTVFGRVRRDIHGSNEPEERRPKFPPVFREPRLLKKLLKLLRRNAHAVRLEKFLDFGVQT